MEATTTLASRSETPDQQLRRLKLTAGITAVISLNGGVGKTTVTGLLATFLASLGRGPVLAVDTSPDLGNLAERLCEPRARGMTLAGLWRWSEGRSVTPVELSENLGQGPHGLRVIRSPSGPSEMPEPDDQVFFARVLSWLRGFGGAMVLDCASGVLDAPTVAALEAADQVLFVSDGRGRPSQELAEIGPWLPAGRRCWLVLNRTSPRRRGEVSEGVAGNRLSGVVVVPELELASSLISPGFRWDKAPRSWREPFVSLATCLYGPATPG